MKAEALLHPTPAGLYCPPGGFHIDPVRSVERALITHAHSDHARSGHGSVLATRRTLDIMAIRMGARFCGAAQAIGYGETCRIGDVQVTFHPAGHVLGSAQIAVEFRGMRIVVSGDYKRGIDPTAEPFEPVAGDVFVTEATFGMPVFAHPDPRGEAERLIHSLGVFPERTHIVGAYSLGKAQRVIRLLRDGGYDRPIHLHGAMQRLCAYYEDEGVALGDLRLLLPDEDPADGLPGAVVLAPPQSLGDGWTRRFADPLRVHASGWMTLRARARQSGSDLPLVISDHCDWRELTATIRELSPGEVWVTHGREDALVRWCGLNGIAARPLALVGREGPSRDGEDD